jgi:hypothetical protein
MRTSVVKKEKLLIKNDEESSLVDKRFEISNLIIDMKKILLLKMIHT